MLSLFSDTGTVLNAGSNEPMYLCDPSVVYVVESGTVDLFVVNMENASGAEQAEEPTASGDGAPRSASGASPSQTVGRRRHISRCTPGDLLFGAHPGEEDTQVVAIGTLDTRLRRVERSALRDLSKHSEYQPLLRQKVDTWIERISRNLRRDQGTDRAHPTHLVVDAEGTLRAGQHVTVRSGVCWVRHRDGRSHLVGHDSAVLSGSAGFPLTRFVRIEAETNGTLQTASTETLMRMDVLWDEVDRFNTRALKVMGVEGEAQLQMYRNRFRKQKANDLDGLQSAYRTLAGILDTDYRSSFSRLDNSKEPLHAALKIIGEHQHIDFQFDDAAPAVDGADEVKSALRPSGVRARKVLLRGEWWSADSGPLLAQYKENDSPIALLPDEGRGAYTLIDPVREAVRAVDADVDDEIKPFAYSLYRPFPERAIGAFDLVRHAFEGNSRDALLIVAMSVAAALLNMIVPIATGMIFETIIPEAERTQLIQITATLLLAASGVMLLNVTRNVSLTRLSARMHSASEAALMDRVLKLPTSFFRGFSAGDLADRVQSITQIRHMMSGAVATSLLSGVFAMLNIILLFFYSDKLTGTWTLAWWGIALIALAAAIIAGFGMIQLRYEREISDMRAALSGHVLQLITGITKLRVAGAEAKAFQQWSKRFSQQEKLEYGARRVGAISMAIEHGIPTFSLLVIFWQMMTLSQEAAQTGGGLSTGYFLAFHAAFLTCLGGIRMMKGAFINMLKVIPRYELMRPILEVEPEVQTDRTPPGHLTGEVRMQRVDFRYTPNDDLVLRDVSIEAEPGEFIALVGPSGSGKSTVLRLLLGFEQPESGSVFYDDQSLSKLDLQAVRQQIGVVLQDSRALPGDIRTNIVGTTMASLDDAWRAAEMAGLKDDIKAMPMGMNTVISTGGGTLSGGQRQRLMIARALVSNPSLIYFDEATSALDNRTQAIVSQSLDELAATRVVIAHRLSTIRGADRIYVLDRGRVVQQGSYDELMEEDGIFFQLVQRQIA